MMVNPYDTLGVPKTASKDQIKSAYRKQAKAHHPDSGVTPDAAAFSEANHAYKLLTDDSRRAHFDETGQEQSSGIDDPIQGRAMNMLGQVFMQVVQRDDALSIKVPQVILDELHKLLAGHENALKNGLAEEAKLKKMQKRLRRKKKEGVDYLAHLIANQIVQIQGPLASARMNVDACKRAIELMDQGYEFDADPPTIHNSVFVAEMPPGSISMEEILNSIRRGR